MMEPRDDPVAHDEKEPSGQLSRKALMQNGALLALSVPAVGLFAQNAHAARRVRPASASSKKGTILMKVGHDSPTTHPYQYGVEVFKAFVELGTSGRISVKIFPNAQLGDEATMLNGLKVGAVDALFVSTQPLSLTTEEIELFDLPFVFRDVDHSLRVANGPIGTALAAKVNPAVGGKLAGWGTIGERDMWNSKHPIKSVADVKGLKMRIQQSPIQAATYKALGALPTVTAFTELFTSLQTGVVDGADPGPVDIQAEKFYQVAKYLTFTRHFQELVPFIISTKFLEGHGLSSQDQNTLLTAGSVAANAEAQAIKLQQGAAAQFIEKQGGMKATNLSSAQRAAFIKACKPVYAQFATKVGGTKLIQRVQSTP